MEPRPAATVVVAREGLEGLEVLVLQRSEASRFAPRFLVFPGGSVEQEDAALASEWFGTEDEAPRACAIRELYEEAGIVATRAGLVAEPPDRPITALEFDPPGPEQLPEMARWIAPEVLPVRFDARFYAAAAPAHLEPVPDGVEIERGWWTDASTVLAAAAAGEVPLMWPTLKTLQALRECRTPEDVLALRVPQVEPPIGRDAATRPGALS